MGCTSRARRSEKPVDRLGVFTYDASKVGFVPLRSNIYSRPSPRHRKSEPAVRAAPKKVVAKATRKTITRIEVSVDRSPLVKKPAARAQKAAPKRVSPRKTSLGSSRSGEAPVRRSRLSAVKAPVPEAKPAVKRSKKSVPKKTPVAAKRGPAKKKVSSAAESVETDSPVMSSRRGSAVATAPVKPAAVKKAAKGAAKKKVEVSSKGSKKASPVASARARSKSPAKKTLKTPPKKRSTAGATRDSSMESLESTTSLASSRRGSRTSPVRAGAAKRTPKRKADTSSDASSIAASRSRSRSSSTGGRAKRLTKRMAVEDVLDSSLEDYEQTRSTVAASRPRSRASQAESAPATPVKKRKSPAPRGASRKKLVSFSETDSDVVEPRTERSSVPPKLTQSDRQVPDRGLRSLTKSPKPRAAATKRKKAC